MYDDMTLKGYLQCPAEDVHQQLIHHLLILHLLIHHFDTWPSLSGTIRPVSKA